VSLLGAQGERIALPAGRGPVGAPGSVLHVSIRRDRIEVVKAPAVFNWSEQTNAVLGTIHALEYQGSYVKLTIDLASGEEFVAHVTDDVFFRETMEIGDRVICRWSARDLHLLQAAESAADATAEHARPDAAVIR
jgi:hypothetical protein